MRQGQDSNLRAQKASADLLIAGERFNHSHLDLQRHLLSNILPELEILVLVIAPACLVNPKTLTTVRIVTPPKNEKIKNKK